jgi:hypothetical protein
LKPGGGPGGGAYVPSAAVGELTPAPAEVLAVDAGIDTAGAAVLAAGSNASSKLKPDAVLDVVPVWVATAAAAAGAAVVAVEVGALSNAASKSSNVSF